MTSYLFISVGSMPKIRIEKSDKYRVLLTDTLPYETPIIFSNEGFHGLQSKGMLNIPLKLKKFIDSISQSETICAPHQYKIRRSQLKTRTLTLIHPCKQLLICDLYSDYADYIVYLCGKSNYSIRKPSSISSVFYKKIPIANDSNNDGDKTASTYFSYQKYKLLYQFYASRKFINLEKKFQHLRVFDITKCFNSIYTHSICWAIKGKKTAKADSGCYNFENRVDKLMQKINLNETAGIVIGPEFSRIFAEIILQFVDVEVERRLTAKKKKNSIDYEVCRYVDDYYVFTNNIHLLDEIQSEFQLVLEEFRMHVNESKVFTLHRPFSSDISNTKEDLNNSLNRIIESISIISGDLAFQKVSIDGWDTINAIKVALTRNKIQFQSVNGYIFWKLKSVTKKMLNSSTVVSTDNAYEYIQHLISVCFYVYSQDVRVSTTYSMAVIVNNLFEFIKAHLDGSRRKNVEKMVFDEVHSILKQEVISNGTSLIELVNILLIVKKVSSTNKLPQSLLLKIAERLEKEKFNYLAVFSVLHFCGNSSDYESCKRKIIEIIKLYVKSINGDMHESAMFHLFFDYISCPYIDDASKREIFSITSLGSRFNQQEVIDSLQYISSNEWFIDWNENFDLSRKLQKKEYISPYE